MVLLPGLAGGWPLMTPLARVLARRFRVILVNLEGDRGRGGSLRHYSVEDEAAGLARCLQRLGLERPSLMGVSYGGAVALQLAADEPELIESLILYGVDARFEHRGAAGLARQVLERYELPGDNPFLNQFFNLLHGTRPEPGPMVDFIQESCWATDQGVMARRLEALEEFDLRDRLGDIRTPTLVLAGDRDAIVRPARQQELARALLGARYRRIDGAGHIGFLSRRGRIARLVWEFLQPVRIGA